MGARPHPGAAESIPATPRRPGVTSAPDAEPDDVVGIDMGQPEGTGARRAEDHRLTEPQLYPLPRTWSHPQHGARRLPGRGIPRLDLDVIPHPPRQPQLPV